MRDTIFVGRKTRVLPVPDGMVRTALSIVVTGGKGHHYNNQDGVTISLNGGTLNWMVKVGTTLSFDVGDIVPDGKIISKGRNKYAVVRIQERFRDLEVL